MKKTNLLYLIAINIIFLTGCKKDESNPTDPNASIDPKTVTYAGKTYNTVKIGNQLWLKENLNVGIMINGSQNQSNNNTIEKYCYGNNEANCNTYGGLYQWNEAMQYGTQAICPPGWRIPKIEEYQTLDTAVNNNSNALKAAYQGTGSGQGTNTSGFSALLAGSREYNGYFGSMNKNAYFWRSSEYSATGARSVYLIYNGPDIFYNSISRESGFSVRCIKD